MKVQVMNYNAQTADSALMQLVEDWEEKTKEKPHYLDIFCSDYSSAKCRVDSMWNNEVLYVIVSAVGLEWHYGEIYNEQQMLKKMKDYHFANVPRMYRVTCISQKTDTMQPWYKIEVYV